MSSLIRAHISLRIEERGQGVKWHFTSTRFRILLHLTCLKLKHWSKDQMPCILILTKFRALICIMCIKDQTNALNSTGVFLLCYIYLHASAGNPTFVRVTFLLQEYIVISSDRLLHSVENHMIIGSNFL